jgi:hypothetical protein
MRSYPSEDAAPLGLVLIRMFFIYKYPAPNGAMRDERPRKNEMRTAKRRTLPISISQHFRGVSLQIRKLMVGSTK